MKLHPLEVTHRIREDYIRYLKSFYFFRQEELREQFHRALEAPDFLVKGPYLEAATPYQRGWSIDQLIQAGVLSAKFRQLASSEFSLERPLYRHQEQAIEKVAQGSRNIVVATGTGSGKTESFLYPILNHLLREAEAGTLTQPGVRALLLYPMNALANDQLDRLRKILGHYKGIKFGRYTGETEENAPQPADKNELVSRELMRQWPPHILLTNYAMLEYLLLRPQDCEFFDGKNAGHWRFIVLDEAHIYDGAEGIEIAMLLRRLKDRIVQSQPGKLCCIATSATLGRGREDFPQVAEFAQALFNEPFEWVENDPQRQDIIEASREVQAALGEPWGAGTPLFYQQLSQLFQERSSLAAVADIALKSGVPAALVDKLQKETAVETTDKPAQRLLYRLLQGDLHLHCLRQALTEPLALSELAIQVFKDDPQGLEQLVQLVDLAVKAQHMGNDAPLLPTRYHLFARALEGAFLCLNEAAHQQGESRLYLNRHERCPHCGSQVFEIATCPRCGVIYLVGYQQRQGRIDYLVQSPGQDAQKRTPKLEYFVLTKNIVGLDEDEELVEKLDDPQESETVPYTLCLKCGALASGENARLRCECAGSGMPPVRIMVYRVTTSRETRSVRRCVSCGGQRTAGLIYRIATGRDAPAGVLATSLYQMLPPQEETAPLPGGGRKLLTFSDSRQDAAFFAPYIERTYNRSFRRRLIYLALLRERDVPGDPLHLEEVAVRLRSVAEEAGVFSPDTASDGRLSSVRTWLMQELTALDNRLSLDGLGLLTFHLAKPERWRPLQGFLQAPWNLTSDEMWTLLTVFLDILRQQGVVTIPSGVDVTDPVFAPRNRELFIRSVSHDRYGILGWSPRRRSNRRLDYLVRLLSHIDEKMPEEQATDQASMMLEEFWRYLTDQSFPGNLSLVVRELPGIGSVYQADHQLWEWVPAFTGSPSLYRCSCCQTVTGLSLRGLCPRYACPGKLEPVLPNDPMWEQNHYRHLMTGMNPIPLNAQEHTAQWNTEQATRIQNEFSRGAINLLSCSTTFELGVDLGSLQTVLMRNVPPATANYLQRAGRAGRRTDTAAFVVTYAQRRSHDLSYFSEPRRLISGAMVPPHVTIENEKIVRRHVHSVLWAAFLRWARQQRGQSYKCVGDFFAPSDPRAFGPGLLKDYLSTRPEELRSALLRVVPLGLHSDLGIQDWQWVKALTTAAEDGILDLAVKEVTSDLDLYQKLIAEAEKKSRKGKFTPYENVVKSLRSRDLLGFLGSRNVLPKYGFPFDVVSLRTQHIQDEVAQQVELQRDLKIAISEFAPGGQVVAAGKIWTSRGVYKQPGRDWQVIHYMVCPQCNHYHRWTEHISGGVCEVCGTPLDGKTRLRGRFIEPRFGFLADRTLSLPGDERPQRFYASQVFFADYEKAPPDFQPVAGFNADGLNLTRRYSRYGRLVLVNNGAGEGFYICPACGYAEAGIDHNEQNMHKSLLTDRPCGKEMQSYHLGHEFITDVLELRFAGSLAASQDPDLWISLLYALLEGASSALNIPRDNLNGVLSSYQGSPIPAMILFDNVPGGAAFVRQLGEHIVDVFRFAWERVEKCECGREISCHQCLRNYYNHYYHDRLQRGIVADFLAKVLESAGVELSGFLEKLLI